ncbi:Retrovirus-related Pol polyprotein from transposon [Sesamum angolense]|uniref:Retrovirus-related Pol polyprotein from transposon n=1 Tax=Sesamum angolense TaxID=2727404 RepID=A0AAE2BZ51_9LAMI|nr:Retrovirus-related Pol polyprotein from transposon [Sesamum angolense]
MLELPTRETVKDLRGFLGLTSYYRRFIHRCGKIAKPLTELLKKNASQRTEEMEKGFEKLKRAMSKSPILKLLDLNKEFIVETDASGTSIGAKYNSTKGTRSYHQTTIYMPECLTRKGKLLPLPILERTWEDISMDFINGLPPSLGNDTVLALVDCLNKLLKENLPRLKIAKTQADKRRSERICNGLNRNNNHLITHTLLKWFNAPIEDSTLENLHDIQSSSRIMGRLRARFGESNGPMIYQIQRKIASVSQGSMQILTMQAKAQDYRKCTDATYKTFQKKKGQPDKQGGNIGHLKETCFEIHRSSAKWYNALMGKKETQHVPPEPLERLCYRIATLEVFYLG